MKILLVSRTNGKCILSHLNTQRSMKVKRGGLRMQDWKTVDQMAEVENTRLAMTDQSQSW